MICTCGASIPAATASCWVCGTAVAPEPKPPFCRECGAALEYRGGRPPKWCAEHRAEAKREYRRDYWREYQRRPEVAEKQREYRQKPEARPVESDPMREVLLRITEEMQPFTAVHRLAVAALANGASREALEQILGLLHPESGVYEIVQAAMTEGR